MLLLAAISCMMVANPGTPDSKKKKKKNKKNKVSLHVAVWAGKNGRKQKRCS